MAIPTNFTADMLKAMMNSVDDVRPRQSLFASRGFVEGALKLAKAQGPATDNPLYAGYTTTLMGIPVKSVNIPPEQVIDWSGCRSPSRAKRRHARGIPQRIKVEYRERAYLIDQSVLTSWQNMFEARMMSALLGKE